MAKTFDPKKAGQVADDMIKNLQTQQPAAAEPALPASDAQPTPSNEPAVAADVSTPAVTPPAAPQSNSEVEALKQRVQAAEQAAREADQRWRSLQGMIDKRDSELDQMRQLIATLQQPPKEPERPQSFVTKADEDAFGADMIDLNRRVAKETVNAEVNQLKQYIAKLEDKLGIVSQATVQNNQARFEERLDFAVPNWTQINEDPGFIAWLGKYRLVALRTAYQEFDVDGVAQFFKDYIASLPKPAAAPVQPSAEEIVAPGKGNNGTPPSAPAENIWTREDIARLYRDKQEGRISAADFAKAEVEIFRQANAGKIAA